MLNDITPIRAVRSDVLNGIERRGDLIVSNPPYLVDRPARLSSWRRRTGPRPFGPYRQGQHRATLSGRPPVSLHWHAVIDGVDMFLRAFDLDWKRGSQIPYEEIDPDVFGEELDRAPYDRAVA